MACPFSGKNELGRRSFVLLRLRINSERGSDIFQRLRINQNEIFCLAFADLHIKFIYIYLCNRMHLFSSSIMNTSYLFEKIMIFLLRKTNYVFYVSFFIYNTIV